MNSGVIRTDVAVNGKNLTFSDLGLLAGGNANSFVISSAFLGNSDTYSELTAGELSGTSGLLISGHTDFAGLQILTKEGVHLAGTPLSQIQIQSLISSEKTVPAATPAAPEIPAPAAKVPLLILSEFFLEDFDLSLFLSDLGDVSSLFLFGLSELEFLSFSFIIRVFSFLFSMTLFLMWVVNNFRSKIIFK